MARQNDFRMDPNALSGRTKSGGRLSQQDLNRVEIIGSELPTGGPLRDAVTVIAAAENISRARAGVRVGILLQKGAIIAI